MVERLHIRAYGQKREENSVAGGKNSFSTSTIPFSFLWRRSDPGDYTGWEPVVIAK